MKKIVLSFWALGISIIAQTNINHAIRVNINPATSEIEVVDTMLIKKGFLKDNPVYTLNSNFTLKLLSDNASISLIKSNLPAEDIGMDRDENSKSSIRLNQYAISDYNENEDLQIIVSYAGKVHSPIKQSEENYQRGFSESPGIISETGIYLAGSTNWVPTFEDELVTFKLTTHLPKSWKTVSQGKRIFESESENVHIDTWAEEHPQEEVFLIAAKFNEYKDVIGSVSVYAFLRTPDDAIANKYIETTAQYLEMYRKLIGPFPYSKFALVENFWETGYGMPSFTLLGEKIIRFPFILHSSYPHELLHNWWGNSVYVNFDEGNWCEGLTAYMADHLIKEQRNQATEYRRATLQKFTNYVNTDNDFPLNKFLSRTNAATEAIGYGKMLMVWHMLRQLVGDENFVKSLQTFNRKNKFIVVSFPEIKKAFEETTGDDLTWFFDQWIYRTGAPELKLGDVTVSQDKNNYNISLSLSQIQDGKPFILDVPIVVGGKNKSEIHSVRIKDKTKVFNFKVDFEPLKILVDPQFDLMRILDPSETPAAFTEAMGSQKNLIILPQKNDEFYEEYLSFSKSWIKGKENKFEIKGQDEINVVDNNKTIWVFGNTNKFVNTINKELEQFGSYVNADSIKLADKTLPTINNSFLAIVSNTNNPENVKVFFSIGNKDAVEGLNRKLPHYGKYSYLAFEGDEPTNVHKGQWKVINSPLNKNLSKDADNVSIVFEKRKALAELSPVFSSNRMMEHVKYLSSEEFKGRALGSEENKIAANYIAERFSKYGLLPGGDNNTYFQNFERTFEGKGKLKGRNVIAYVKGSNPELNEAVVVSAHYDHLGLGWPDARKGNEGKIHYGADDNASGVAVILELSRLISKSKPARDVVFIAFDGEEAGLVGSKYFIDNLDQLGIKGILANINFDTVGRLFDKKIMVLNSNTAREWKFIFMGTEYTTGISSELITQQLDASDQVSFINKGIPAIQIFSGPNEDYHRPTDVAEKIDPEGLIKIAALGKEVIEYLAERKEPMNFTGSKASATNTSKGKSSNRRVSTGTMPDFTYQGEGVRVKSVSENSAGANAGLLSGDIIKKINGKKVITLKEYSDVLKGYSPGDKIEMEVERNGEMVKLNLTLKER